MNIRAVIFDLDGPILDSFREGLRRIKIICAIYDLPFNREHNKRLTHLWGLPGVELIMHGLGLNKKCAKDIFYPAWERFDIQQPIPFVPRTREVLAWLKRNKILCTVLTSRHREHIIEMLDRLDLLSNFAVLSTKFDTPHIKPDPRVFRHTLEGLQEKFQIAKNEVIFVGDTPADIDAGKAANIETLLVQTGPYLLKHASKIPIELKNVLNSIDDVPGWIEENGNNYSLTPYD